MYLFTSAVTQIHGQVRIRLILQLTKGNSRVLQKLLKNFNGTAISGFITWLLVLVKNLALNLNELDSPMGGLLAHLWYCHKLPVVNE